MPDRRSAEEVRRIIESGEAVICYSRCLWCGRRTPHELCHAHDSACGGSMAGEREWANYDAEPEVCADPACPGNN